MTVSAAYSYRDGRRLGPVALGDPVPDGADFVWISVVAPDDRELEALARRCALHPQAIEDASDDHVRPKLTLRAEELVINARTVILEGDAIRYGTLALFVGRDHLISVRTGAFGDPQTVRDQLEESPELLAKGVDYVLYAILDFVVGGYAQVVDAIEEDLIELEREALDAFLKRDGINRLFKLRRELARFNRIMDPTEEMLGRLDHVAHEGIDADVRPYFRDVHDQVRRVAARAESARDGIGSILELSSLLEQHRQGDITRKLAAWAAILAVPTAIAGIYGMNFEVMPELHWRYGYFAALGLIGSVAGFLYWRFRRNGWL